MAGFKLLVGMWVTCSLTLHCTARCLFGTSDNCAFKCHCKKVTECNAEEVTCPGGCDSDILGYKWTGPACQIGNLAYRKQAMTHVSTVISGVSKAVDGQDQTCVSVTFTQGTLAQWSVDLGEKYRIINIIIHFSKENCCGLDRLRNHFTVRVSSSSPGPDAGVVCVIANSNTIPPITYTISCPDDTTGRYVYYSKLSGGYQSQLFSICEVIVNGYRPIDCSSCPTGVACNDVIGCKNCSGTYQPDCKQACVGGFYGPNCRRKCGKCTTGTICNRINGRCPSGCKQWWLPDLCQTFIALPVPTNRTSTIRNISRTSVDVEWVQITVNDDIAKYYGYEIRHKISSDKNFANKVTSVAHHFGLLVNKVTITDLMANTWYEIVIYPYRVWKGHKEYGFPYNTVKGRTECTEPDKPKLKSVITVPIKVGSKDEVDIIIQDLQNVYSGCDELTEAWIQYKLAGRNKEQSIKLNLKSQTYSLEPEYGGTYLVWLTIENNAGLTSNSDVSNVTVHGPRPPAIHLAKKPTTSTIDIVIPVVVSFLYLLAIAIFVAYCIKCNK